MLVKVLVITSLNKLMVCMKIVQAPMTMIIITNVLIITDCDDDGDGKCSEDNHAHDVYDNGDVYAGEQWWCW